MSNLSRFSDYAAAFEVSFKSDDWAGVEPFFAEAAVFTTGIGEVRVVGRQAVLNHFKADLDGFDRCFDSHLATEPRRPRAGAFEHSGPALRSQLDWGGHRDAGSRLG